MYKGLIIAGHILLKDKTLRGNVSKTHEDLPRPKKFAKYEFGHLYSNTYIACKAPFI